VFTLIYQSHPSLSVAILTQVNDKLKEPLIKFSSTRSVVWI